MRESYPKPRIAIVGRGRAGKDVSGAWFGANTPLRYVGSTSNVVCPLIARELGISAEEAWLDRHNNRMFWYNWCNEYRKDDPAKIAKVCLENGDIVVGLRDWREIEAIKELHIVDLVIWIERNVPEDPTMTYGPEYADIVINNNGTIEELYEKLWNLSRFAGLIDSDRLYLNMP